MDSYGEGESPTLAAAAPDAGESDSEISSADASSDTEQQASSSRPTLKMQQATITKFLNEYNLYESYHGVLTRLDEGSVAVRDDGNCGGGDIGGHNPSTLTKQERIDVQISRRAFHTKDELRDLLLLDYIRHLLSVEEEGSEDYESKKERSSLLSFDEWEEQLVENHAAMEMKAMNNVTNDDGNCGSMGTMGGEVLTFDDICNGGNSSSSGGGGGSSNNNEEQPLSLPPKQYTTASRGTLQVEQDGTHTSSGRWALTADRLENSETLHRYHFGLECGHAAMDAKNMLDSPPQMEIGNKRDLDDDAPMSDNDGQQKRTQPTTSPANSTFPVDSTRYKGSFKLPTHHQGGSSIHQRQQTIIDRQLVLKYIKNSNEGGYNVYGRGANQFGAFDIVGSLVLHEREEEAVRVGGGGCYKNSGELTLYRLYHPLRIENVLQATAASSTEGEVGVEKKEEECRNEAMSENTKLAAKECSVEQEEESHESASVSLEELARVLFQPGMKFRGHICVPGLTGAMLNEDGSDDDDDNDGSDDNEGNDMMSEERINQPLISAGHAAASDEHEASEERESGKTYELVILKRGRDALGHDYLLATHSAYGDEQSVHIQLNIKEMTIKKEDQKEKDGDCAIQEGSNIDTTTEKQLVIEYSDGETCCVGKLNPNKFRMEGHVRQRMQANDGIFHTKEVTHVFTLYPCTACCPKGIKLRSLGKSAVNNEEQIMIREKDLFSRDTKAIIAHRHRTYNALRQSLQFFIELFQVLQVTSTEMHKLRLAVSRRYSDELAASFLDEKQQLLWELRGVSWTTLLNEACRVNGERLCAEFRLRATHLDKLTFQTTQDRNGFAKEWKDAKLDLKAAHAEWSSLELQMNALAQMIFIFEHERGMLFSFSIRYRLRVSYECLESAYRRAEARLPRDALSRYEIPAEEKQTGLGDAVCIICQSPLLDVNKAKEGEEESVGCLYRLPCSHAFHETCVQQWLHDHSSCPVCRHDLAAEEIGNPPVDTKRLRLKVKGIIEACDREKVTVKEIRKMLEDWFDTDLSEYKDDVRDMIVEMM